MDIKRKWKKEVLLPFELDLAGNLLVRCEVSLCHNEMRLRYHLSGGIEQIVQPEQQRRFVREDGLWQSTCFECFINPVGCEEYWELNLSPGGAWNLYHFTACRRNMQEETRIQNLHSQCRISGDEMTLCCSLSLTFLASRQQFNLGLSAVIKRTDGRKEYWALAHPAVKPDFHDSRGWLLSLARP